MAAITVEAMSMESLIERAVRREKRILLFYAAERVNHHKKLIKKLTIAICVLFLLALAIPMRGQRPEVTTQWTIDRIGALQQQAAISVSETGANAGRIETLNKRVDFLSQQIIEAKEQLAFIRGLGASFAIILTFLQIWSIVRPEDKERIIQKERKRILNKENNE